MEFVFSPCWLYNKEKGLIVNEEEDFKVLIGSGYSDSPKAAKDGVKHPAYEQYFENSGVKKPEIRDVDSDIPLEEVDNLSWPELKKYAKKLEGVFKTDIVSRHSKKADVLKKIKELRNANSSSTH